MRAEVLRYLLAHPDSKDTLEGIMNWWLPGGGAGVSKLELMAVLDELERDGWIEVQGRSGGTVLYGLPPHRRPATSQ